MLTGLPSNFLCGNVGTYSWIGASRSTRPFCHSWNKATAVSGLLMLAIRITVFGEQWTSFSISAYPSPSLQTTLPFLATTTTAPGMPCSNMARATSVRLLSVALLRFSSCIISGGTRLQLKVCSGVLSLSKLVLHLARVKPRGEGSERAELECDVFFHICQPTDAAAPTAQPQAVSHPLEEILFILERYGLGEGSVASNPGFPFRILSRGFFSKPARQGPERKAWVRGWMPAGR